MEPFGAVCKRSPQVQIVTFKAAGEEFARWRSQRKDRIDNIGVYSADGTMVATSNPNRALVGESLLSNTNSDTLQYVLHNAEPALGLPLRSKTTGRPIVPYYSPVRTASGKLVGVFSVTLSLQSLSDTIDVAPTGPWLEDGRHGQHHGPGPGYG